MIALIDADLICYRCAASCEPSSKNPYKDPVDVAVSRADELMYRILETTQASDYKCFLSGEENFRKTLYPNYKANRPLEKPEWLQPVRQFLVEHWKAEICVGYEADDGMGMAANTDTIICSIDKDLLQIPGKHYNFVKDSFVELDIYEAGVNFWSQMLIGDSSDNIPGIPGLGKVKAPKMLLGLTLEEMEHKVKQIYLEHEMDYKTNHTLLRILRTKEEWQEIYENLISKSQREETTEISSG